MQGLVDGYFVLPYTIGTFLANEIRTPSFSTDTAEFEEAEQAVGDRLNKFIEIQGNQSVESFHRRLGKIMWEYCGMSRNAAGLKKGIELILMPL